jgi:undecaprenyl-diphosphatase
MSLLHVVILSIIEGITEFLPISSTGHLILANKLLGIAPTTFTKSFDIAIQFGAILAVVTLYAKTLLTKRDLWPKLALALAPTLVVGFFLYPFIRSYLLESAAVTAWALLIGGVLLWLIEYILKKKQSSTSLTLKSSVGIGAFQSMAVVPGVSRAGATIVGGMLLGLSRKDAVEFSFLLAVPTMAAATGLDLVRQGWAFTGQELGLLVVGLIVSWVTAIFAVRYFLKYVAKNSLIPFAIYRIFLALAFFFFGGA